MSNFIKKISEKIFSLHRYSKRAIAIVSDATLCVFCTWFAFAIRSEYWLSIKPQMDRSILFEDFTLSASLISVVIALPIFGFLGCIELFFVTLGFQFFLLL